MDAKLFIVLTIFLTIVLTFTKIVKRKMYRIITALGLLLLVTYWFSFTERQLPFSLLVVELKGYTLDNITKGYFERPKGKLLKEIVNIPFNDPLRFIIGSGPGTFNSRAALLKYKISNNKDHVGLGGNREELLIKNYKLLQPTETITQKKYYGILNDRANNLGSLYERKSTRYLAIIYEFGLIGFGLFIYFFYKLFKTSFTLTGYDKMILFSFILCTIVICYFSFWMELLNFSTINYAFIGMFIAHNK